MRCYRRHADSSSRQCLLLVSEQQSHSNEIFGQRRLCAIPKISIKKRSPTCGCAEDHPLSRMRQCTLERIPLLLASPLRLHSGRKAAPRQANAILRLVCSLYFKSLAHSKLPDSCDQSMSADRNPPDEELRTRKKIMLYSCGELSSKTACLKSFALVTSHLTRGG